MAQRRRSRYDAQVEAETSLKYGPQGSALALLLSNAQGDRNQSLAVNTSTANALSNAARLAQPEVNKANESYLAQLLQAKTTLGADTAGLSQAADPFKAASARDMANAQTRAAETTKAASNELTQRGLDARAGAMAGARAIGDRYNQQAGQIAQQIQSLAGESGTFAASRIAELLGEDAKTAHDTAEKGADRRTSLLTAGVNPDGTYIKGGPKDPAVKDRNKPRSAFAGLPGVKPATTEALGKVGDAITGAHSEIQDFIDVGLSRADIGRLFVKGRKAGSRIDEQKLKELQRTNPHANPVDLRRQATVKWPAVPKVPALALSVALDLAFDQHVSANNVKRLHERGLSVKALGLPTGADAARRRTPGYVPAQGA